MMARLVGNGLLFAFASRFLLGVTLLSGGLSVLRGGWFGVDSLSIFGFGPRLSSLEIAFYFVAFNSRPSSQPIT